MLIKIVVYLKCLIEYINVLLVNNIMFFIGYYKIY